MSRAVFPKRPRAAKPRRIDFPKHPDPALRHELSVITGKGMRPRCRRCYGYLTGGAIPLECPGPPSIIIDRGGPVENHAGTD